MDFVQVSGSDLRSKGIGVASRGRRDTEVVKILKNFENSNMKYAKILDWEMSYSSIFSAYSSLRRFIKIWNLPIEVVMHNNDLYLHHF